MSAKKRDPITDTLPFSPSYHPDLCSVCLGVGFTVDRSEARYGELHACTSCNKQQSALLSRCWTVSTMEANVAAPPSIVSFIPHSPDSTAVAAAIKAFVRKPSGWITFWGSTGTGKSHITEALARHFLGTGMPCVFINATALWEYLGAVERGEHERVDYAERFRYLCDLPALIVDEINVEKSTDFVHKTRRSLFDHRYRAALDGKSVTVLASNDEPSTWADEKVGDRALDDNFVVVHTGTVSYQANEEGSSMSEPVKVKRTRKVKGEAA